MMSTRPHWSAFELAERLEITERTVRRDITQLREIGYPVEAAPGVHGGYRLGSGGKIPPLLLDDDEAVSDGDRPRRRRRCRVLRARGGGSPRAQQTRSGPAPSLA